jgi:hypothetical protein
MFPRLSSIVTGASDRIGDGIARLTDAVLAAATES